MSGPGLLSNAEAGKLRMLFALQMEEFHSGHAPGGCRVLPPPRDIRRSTLSSLAAPYVALIKSPDDRALPVVGSMTRRTSTI